jgi:hypothetical protein
MHQDYSFVICVSQLLCYRRYHTSHHMALFALLNLMNGQKQLQLISKVRSIVAFRCPNLFLKCLFLHSLQTIQGDHSTPRLFAQIIQLPKLFEQEIRYSTQEILVEILARFYHILSKSKDDARHFEQLCKALPVPLLNTLKDSSRGPKYVLDNTR